MLQPKITEVKPFSLLLTYETSCLMYGRIFQQKLVQGTGK